MRIFKRLEAAVLTAALALSLVVLPASAAPGSFTDVSDPNTALNADILRLMGVVSGTGENRFNPSGSSPSSSGGTRRPATPPGPSSPT